MKPQIMGWGEKNKKTLLIFTIFSWNFNTKREFFKFLSNRNDSNIIEYVSQIFFFKWRNCLNTSKGFEFYRGKNHENWKRKKIERKDRILTRREAEREISEGGLTREVGFEKSNEQLQISGLHRFNIGGNVVPFYLGST